MAQFFRAHSSIIIALGTGLALGTSITILIQRLRRSLDHDIARLVRQIENLRVEVEKLKSSVEEDVHSPQRAPLSDRRLFHSPRGSDEEEDVFEEAYGGSDDDSNHSASGGGPDEFLSMSPVNGSLEDVSQLFVSSDELMEGSDTDKEQAYELLRHREHKMKSSSDFLWRMAKASFFMSQIEGGRSNAETKKALVYSSRDHALKALNLEPNSSDVHKWYAITMGSVGDYETTQVKIENGYKFKEHIEKAIALQPTDPSAHYLLGRWCYGVYMLSWIERQVAATLFASPPSSTVDEALQHFLEADRLKPGTWKENLLFVAKCYIEKSEYSTAVDWLDKANKVEVIAQDDRTAQKEVDSLLYKYSGYRR